jgi:peptide/nickel transport system substrate-binding protein
MPRAGQATRASERKGGSAMPRHITGHEPPPRPDGTAAPPSRRAVLARGGQVLLAAAAAGALGPLASACGPAASDARLTRVIKPGGTLLAGVTSDPDSLDPQKSSLAVSAEIYDGIFSRLVDLQADGTFTPSLATSWHSPDDRTYVFNLRPDVAFHNGDPLTPEDVIFTFDRIASPSFGSTYAAYFAALSGVERTGPSQVTFHLRQPFAPLLANLANRGHILSRRAIADGEPSSRPVGTGPFALGSWNQGENITLTKNPRYFVPGRPYLDKVEFSYFADDESRVLALQSAQVDWVDAIPLQSITSTRSNPTLRYVTSSVTGKPEFLFFNTTRPPLDNKALRQAICWAINRQEIAQAGFFGEVEPGSAEVGRDSPWYTPGADPYEKAPDPAMVARKLAAAGLPRGGVSIKFAAWTSTPDAVRTAQIVQQQLAPFGINIEIETMEISVWISQLFKKNYQMTLAFQEQIIDPDNFWSLIWTSNASENVTGYRNPVVDRLVAQAAAAADASVRKDLYARIRAMVLDDAPTLFTAYLPLGYASAGNVLGDQVNPVQDPQFVKIGFSGSAGD